MRLRHLQLIRFGPFTDRPLDFGPDGQDLHLIYGANEAGKSTARRAVVGLLFGFPRDTPDGYIHGSDMLLGAGLQASTGQIIEIKRRKGARNTLLDTRGHPLDEAVLTDWLHGTSRGIYESMFGLDHRQLETGGTDILTGKGDLGRSLFAASTGARNLHDLCRSLQEDADRLFKPKAKNLPLNKALLFYRESKDACRKLSLKPSQWQEKQDQLRDTDERIAANEVENGRISSEVARLKRLQRILPAVAAREQSLVRRRALGEVRVIDAQSADMRRKAVDDQTRTETGEIKCHEQKQRLQEESEKLHVPELLLENGSAIEEIRSRLSVYREGLNDLPKSKTKVAAAHQNERAILKRLGHGESLDDAERLRVDLRAKTRIRKLTETGTRLETEKSKAKRDAALARQRLHKCEEDYRRLAAPRDTSTLHRLATDVRKLGDLEEMLRETEGELQELDVNIHNQLSALLLWTGPLEQVEALPLPPRDTVERFREQRDTIRKKWDLTRANRVQIEESKRRVSSALRSLQEHGAVPSEEALGSAREERERTWQQIRMSWIAGEPSGTLRPEALAAQYEESVRATDEISDRLRGDAQRVANYRANLAENERITQDLVNLDHEIAQLKHKADTSNDEWKALWAPAGITPLPPAEMQPWLGRHEKLAEKMAGRRVLLQERDGKSAEIGDFRVRLCQELAAVGEQEPSPDTPLASLLDMAENVLSRLDEMERQRSEQHREIERQRGSLQESEFESERCGRELGSWREQWAQAVSSLGLGPDADPGEATAIIDDLDELFKVIDIAAQEQGHIHQIEEYADDFARRVREAVACCTPELTGLPPAEAAQSLINLLDQGRDARKSRENLRERLSEIDDQLANLKSERGTARATLERLMADAGCHTIENLVLAEQRSEEYREIAKELDRVGKELLDRGEGVPLEDLFGQARAADPNALPGTIGEFETRREKLTQDCAELREQRGCLKKELSAMDGTPAAAEAAAEAQLHLSEIKRLVLSYARARLATRLLGEEIARYRETHKGPLLEQAGQYFSRVTCGGYTGIVSDFRDADQPVLLCVRRNGSRVPVEGLSDGTRDQLYLALRLAGIVEHVSRNEPMPLIVDDLLIKFDDDRAQATLTLLAEISRKTQVLFFTHHARLRELASSSISSETLREHELDQPEINSPQV